MLIGDEKMIRETLEAKQSLVQNALIEEVEKFLSRELSIVSFLISNFLW